MVKKIHVATIAAVLATAAVQTEASHYLSLSGGYAGLFDSEYKENCQFVGTSDVEWEDSYGGHSDFLLAGQLGAGVGYAISDHVILDLKYKYLMATEDFEPKDTTIEIPISGQYLQLGVRYTF